MTADNEPSVPDIDQLARSMLALHGAHGDEQPAQQRGSRGSAAPVVPSDPERAAALREATQRDRERYLNWGLQPVDCRFCHISVLVRRLGPGHTSVQWNSQAAQRCAYFAEVREAGGDTARIPTCPKLTDSIDHAIAEGILEPAPSVPPPSDG